MLIPKAIQDPTPFPRLRAFKIRDLSSRAPSDLGVASTFLSGSVVAGGQNSNVLERLGVGGWGWGWRVLKRGLERFEETGPPA